MSILEIRKVNKSWQMDFLFLDHPKKWWDFAALASTKNLPRVLNGSSESLKQDKDTTTGTLDTNRCIKSHIHWGGVWYTDCSFDSSKETYLSSMEITASNSVTCCSIASICWTYSSKLPLFAFNCSTKTRNPEATSPKPLYSSATLRFIFSKSSSRLFVPWSV